MGRAKRLGTPVTLFVGISLVMGQALTSFTPPARSTNTDMAGVPAQPPASNADSGRRSADAPAMLASYGSLPLSFEINGGQTVSSADFVARGRGYALSLAGSGIALALRATTRVPDSDSFVAEGNPRLRSTASVRMEFVGAAHSAQPFSSAALPGKVNYFVGDDPSHWLTNIATYGRVGYRGIYPGIDVAYYGNQGRLEYDIGLKAGADPNQIRLAFEGVDAIRADENGDLGLVVSGGELTLRRPQVHQTIDGVRVDVPASYVVAGAEVRFELGAYDSRRPLVIDPVIHYSTYVGGSAGDGALDIKVDSAGNAYIAGGTTGGFPTTEGAYDTSSSGTDAFVAKLNPAGAALVYATYLGGSLTDFAKGIAIDSSGNAYVSGQTSSTDFPTTEGAVQSRASGGSEAFITKLNAAGSALVYSTYLGGTGEDDALAIAVDSSGNAVVTGSTTSSDFPTAAAFQSDNRGGMSDAFVTKLNAVGTALTFSTYLGGTGKPAEDTYFIALGDYGQSVAVDPAGSVYVAGSTDSRDFPVTEGALQTTHASVPNADPSGFYDGFVAKFAPAGTRIYATYLGGGRTDHAIAIAVDSSGRAYVTGGTASLGDAPFPTTENAFDTTYNYGGDAFVSKLKADGSGPLMYSTYLGGSPGIEGPSGHDEGFAIAVDRAETAYVAGRTTANDFPTVNAFQSANAGGYDAFASKIDTTKSGSASLRWSTYLGGSAQDRAFGVALGPGGSVFAAGDTTSSNFPTTEGAFKTNNSDGFDAFVTKIVLGAEVSGIAECDGPLRGAYAQLVQAGRVLEQVPTDADTGAFDFGPVGPGTFTLKYIEPTEGGPNICGTQQLTIDGDGNATVGDVLSCDPSNTWLTARDLNATLDATRLPTTGVICDGGRLWYKIKLPAPPFTTMPYTVPPLSRIVARLTGPRGGRLPGDFTLMLVKDPNLALQEVKSSADAHAQFAGDTFGGDTFGGDTFGGDTFGGDTFGGDTFGGDTFGGDTFGGDTFGGDTFGGDTFGGDTFGGDTFGGDTFGGDTFGGDTFGGGFGAARNLSGGDPKAYSAAIARSVVRVSAHRGTSQEGLWQNTWANSITWYLRVSSYRGSAGPFELSSQVFTGLCNGVTVTAATSQHSFPPSAGNYETLVLRRSQSEGTFAAANTAALTGPAGLAAHPTVNGYVADFTDSEDPGLAPAYQQFKDNPFCPAAANVVADGVRGYIAEFKKQNPELKWILIAASDEGIPFYRIPDYASIAPQNMLVLPLKPLTIEGELRLNFFGSDDAYGDLDPIRKTDHFLYIPKLGVGRISEPKHLGTMVNAYLAANGVLTPQTAGVFGYNFWNDSATSIQQQLVASGKSVNQFPTAHPKIQSGQGLPTDADAWNAQDLFDGVSANTDILVLMAHGLRASEIAPANYYPTVKPQQLINLANTSPGIKRLKLLVTGACNFALGVPQGQGIANITPDPRTAEIPQALGWTAVAWDTYAYGDDERIAYSEELADDLFRDLRYGASNELVRLGDAMARVKRNWASRQTDLKGIHEKSLMGMSIIGFPMLSVNMGTARLGDRPNGLASFTRSDLVAVTSGPGTDPALNLQTRAGDIAVRFDDPTKQNLVRTNVSLTNLATSGSTTASYYKVATPTNATGFVQTNPNEPIAPRWIVPLHPSDVPPDDPTFARGVVLLRATCLDEGNFVPLISAPAYQLTPPRGPYLADRFEPNDWWKVSYVDPGREFLLIRPGIFRSTRSATGAPENFGTERTFRDATFRAYYSSLVDASVSDTLSHTMQAIQAGPPEFLSHQADPTSAGGIDIEAIASGLPNVGIQSVFFTWWDDAATCGAGGSGLSSVELSQDGTTGRWSKSLTAADLGGRNPLNIRYLLQAVNGAGRVRVADNFGLGFPVQTPPTAPAPLADTALAFVAPPTPTTAVSGRTISVAAKLTRTDTGEIVIGRRVIFHLSGANGDRAFAYTDAQGVASTRMKVDALPGSFFISVEFDGAEDLNGTSARSAAITVNRETAAFTDLSLRPTTQQQGGTIEVSARLVDSATPSRPLREQDVLFLITNPECTAYPPDASGTGCAVLQAQGAETDYAGRARTSITLSVPNGASYAVHAVFAGKVKLPTGDPLAPSVTLSFENARYTPARGSLGAITVVKTRIAFTSSRTGNGDIYSMAADGTDVKQLTNNSAIDADPDWSPDRTKIAFTSSRTGNGDVYVMNGDGTGVTRLTTSNAIDTFGSWSPAGTKIAFTSTRDGNMEIYVMNADGSGQTRLTNNPAVDADPYWSPDGTKIAFTSGRTGNLDVYVMNADGTGVTRLTNNAAVDTLGSWSPDGSRIVFTSGRTGNGDIYTMKPDGTDVTRLTTSSGIDGAPDWSPDGTKIVFASNRDGNSEIYIMNADGTGQTRLTNNPAFDSLPSW